MGFPIACALIVPCDEYDFYAVRSRMTGTVTGFEYHWPYIMQATRGQGIVYKSSDTRIYFYVRSSSARQELVVVTMLGSEKEQGLEIMAAYAREQGMALIIKNISFATLPYWQALGYAETQEPWSIYSPKDDNSFPECLYDLETIAHAHLPRCPGQRRTCRASYAQGIRKYMREREISVTQYDPALHEQAVWRLLEENAAFLERKGVDSRQAVIDAHRFVFDNALLHKVRIVHCEKGRVIGFNYMTVLGTTIFGNALIHANESGLMSFLIWQGFNHVAASLPAVIKYTVSFQGSEAAGQYAWKQGFRPILEIPKTHITRYDY